MQKDTVGELFGALQEAFSIDANPKRAAAMSSYMRDQFQFYGIPSPKRKEIVKLVFENYKYDQQEFISLAKLLWAHPLRENQYVLFDLGYKWVKKMDISLIPFFEKLLVQKSWWDTVDGIGPNFIGKILLNHCSAEVRKKYAVNWNKSSNIWNIRTSIIFQLKYKDKLDFDLACTMILNHIDSKEFFIQKASGWILREYAKTHMTKVKTFVEGHALSNLTKREALKHA